MKTVNYILMNGTLTTNYSEACENGYRKVKLIAETESIPRPSDYSKVAEGVRKNPPYTDFRTFCNFYKKLLDK